MNSIDYDESSELSLALTIARLEVQLRIVQNTWKPGDKVQTKDGNVRFVVNPASVGDHLRIATGPNRPILFYPESGNLEVVEQNCGIYTKVPK